MPSPPASVTPASRRAGSWSMVSASARSAAVSAPSSTASTPSPGRSSAPSAATRRTVSIVPSTGSETAV